MTRNQQWGLGIGAFCVLSVVVYGIGSLTGYHGGSQDPNTAATIVGRVTFPSPSSATTQSAVRPAAVIDQPGDPGTPCAMTYRAEGGVTVVRFQFATGGEIITHLGDKAGDLFRHDDTVTAGSRSYVDGVTLDQVDDAGAIFQDPDGTRHVCSIAPQR